MTKSMAKENYCRANLKRKCFAKGKKHNFKRFKRLPKFVRDNVENQVAREKEKDVYHFSDSEEDERAMELGMGPEISDLPLLNGEDYDLDRQKAMVALTQDTVGPLFRDQFEYDEKKLDEALAELKYSQFRPNQKETIKRILMGRSTLFISPTGSGKSLCYQMPALLYWRFRRYITIIVSPLISLMEDQIRNIPASLKAVTIHSGQNLQQRRNSIQQLVDNEAQIAFITPEAIVGGILDVNDLRNLPPIGFVCIDEAHCLSEWSHNFRPAYLQFMRILTEKLSIKTFLALTATATKATTFGICRCLTINPETDVIGSTTIPDNLILSISYEVNKEKAIIDLLKSPTFRIMPSIIVYCNRRDETERIASTIRTAMQNYSTLIEVPERTKKHSQQAPDNNYVDDNSKNSPDTKAQMKLTWNAEAYHAGLSNQARNTIQRRFIKGEIRIVVATIAFGMGINKANVRAIIHYDMPGSFESYVQEIGRAGRDGKPAQCHMFLRADKADIFYQQRNIYASITEKANIEKLINYIFVPCRCAKILKSEDEERLNKLNVSDPHEIKSWHKTSFTNVPVPCTDEDLDDQELSPLIMQDDSTLLSHGTPNNKENQPVKYLHKSTVAKHRPCKGHEVAFNIDQATSAINLFPESIITFICQLEQAYPQLQIRQFAPIKANCIVHCYKGPEQMEQLAKSCPPVRFALFMHKMDHIKKHGSTLAYETPKKISFDIIKVAQGLAKPSNEVIKMLKKTEWELNDETGRFRRSQIRVGFDGNSFHLKAVGDLTTEELKELKTFLVDHMRKYERIERNKVAKMYQILMRHCIDIDQMKDKITRLQTSIKLKSALNAYFNPTYEQYAHEESVTHIPISIDIDKLSPIVEQAIQKKVSEFVSAHGRDITPRALAKIFQGVSCPNYPAEHWGANRNWWRTFVDVDFLKLVETIQSVLVK